MLFREQPKLRRLRTAKSAKKIRIAVLVLRIPTCRIAATASAEVQSLTFHS